MANIAKLIGKTISEIKRCERTENVMLYDQNGECIMIIVEEGVADNVYDGEGNFFNMEDVE